MKKYIIVAFVLLVFMLFGVQNKQQFANATTKETVNFVLSTEDGKQIKFDKEQICLDKSKLNKFNSTNDNEIMSKTAKKIKNMGFSDTQTVQFLFPGIEDVFDGIQNKINVQKKDAEILFDSKNATFSIEKERVGKTFNREQTAKSILQNLELSNHIKISIATDTLNPEITKPKLQQYCNKKSSFSTWCGSSSKSRKNNIKTACKSISGTRIEPGEIFSFNQATGTRNEQAGYQKAKIITNGSYTEGFGGGVCQVSTTLYNAALLAGLKIIEVHQHSLPVSYVEPSRDAMVSGTSADLKFKNTTSGPIFLRARLVNDEDIKIEIFGQKNEYNYTINSKINQTIPKPNDEIIYTNKIGDEIINDGETKRISYAKEGIVSEAFLTATDSRGNVVFSKKIRSNTYNPTRGIIAKG